MKFPLARTKNDTQIQSLSFNSWYYCQLPPIPTSTLILKFLWIILNILFYAMEVAETEISEAVRLYYLTYSLNFIYGALFFFSSIIFYFFYFSAFISPSLFVSTSFSKIIYYGWYFPAIS